MGVRTYSRAEWTAAQAAWHDGGYRDDLWGLVRLHAARRGMIWPPAGTLEDSIDDESPSQRIIVVRAIRDTPELLRHTIAASSSWSQVVDALIGASNDRRAEAERRDALEAERRSATDIGRVEATAILRRVQS